jgi:hypothetical protein
MMDFKEMLSKAGDAWKEAKNKNASRDPSVKIPTALYNVSIETRLITSVKDAIYFVVTHKILDGDHIGFSLDKLYTIYHTTKSYENSLLYFAKFLTLLGIDMPAITEIEEVVATVNRMGVKAQVLINMEGLYPNFDYKGIAITDDNEPAF